VGGAGEPVFQANRDAPVDVSPRPLVAHPPLVEKPVMTLHVFGLYAALVVLTANVGHTTTAMVRKLDITDRLAALVALPLLLVAWWGVFWVIVS
jgi:hypothetical protein